MNTRGFAGLHEKDRGAAARSTVYAGRSSQDRCIQERDRCRRLPGAEEAWADGEYPSDCRKAQIRSFQRSGIQGSKNPEIQGSRNPGIQGTKDFQMDDLKGASGELWIGCSL